MGSYRKKPVVIEAVQWTGKNLKEIEEFCEGKCFIGHLDRLQIETLEGDMQAQWGDFIIKGIQGEFYPCKGEIFTETYDKVSIEDDDAEFSAGDYNTNTRPFRGPK